MTAGRGRMSRRLPLAVRGAVTTPALSILVVRVVAALSCLGVVAPALLENGRTATIHSALTSLPEISRWPSAIAPGLPTIDSASDADAGVWGGALAELVAQRQQQPEPLRGVLGAPRLSMMNDPAPTVGEHADATTVIPQNRVGLVSDPGLTARSDLVEGRLPVLSNPADGIEVVVTADVAEQLNWHVGDVRRWTDTTLQLTGVITPSGRYDGDWAFISGSRTPLVEVDASGNRTLIAAAFMHVDEMSAFTDRTREIKASAWMPLFSGAIDADAASTVAAQLRLLGATPFSLDMYDETFFNRGLPMESSAPRAIDSGVARGDAMTAVLSVVAVGPIAVSVVVLALVSRLIALRRAASIRMLRARGASRRRLTALLAGEGALLGVAGAVIGVGVGVVLSGWSGWSAAVVPIGAGLVPLIVLPQTALAAAAKAGRADLGARTSHGATRVVVEASLLAVTALLTVLLLTRGAGADGPDPLLFVVPVLLGASGSIMVLRLLPMLLRFAEARGQRAASLSALLGPARALRDAVVRTTPVLAVVVGVGVAVFSVAFVSTVSVGLTRSATADVGADIRIDAAHMTDADAARIASLEGVAAVAGLRGDSTVDVRVEGTGAIQKVRAHLYTIDHDALTAVQQGIETAIPLPAALIEPAADGVPVVASDALMTRLNADDETEIDVSGDRVRIVGTAPAQVPFGTPEFWLIVDSENARALGERSTGMTRLFLALEPGADADAVGVAATAELGGNASFRTPAQRARSYAEDPGFTSVQAALVAAGAIVAVLLLVAVIATLMLGASSRERMLAVLRTQGFRRRGAGRLVLWEVAPALLLALPVGAVVGAGMTWLVIPRLDLREFIGGPEQPPVVFGGGWQVVMVVGFAVVVFVVIAVAAAAVSRLGAAETVDDAHAR